MYMDQEDDAKIGKYLNLYPGVSAYVYNLKN